jgi:hypothetical protein
MKQRVERRSTSWRISAEAQRLLELMAAKLGVSQSAVFEQAIREKAGRENVTMEADAANGTQRRPPESTPEQRAAAERLRQIVEKAREASGSIDPEAVRREVAILRGGVTSTPAVRSGAENPEWRDYLSRLAERVRAGVPEEWSEEELQEHIQQAVDEVRASRAGHH